MPTATAHGSTAERRTGTATSPSPSSSAPTTTGTRAAGTRRPRSVERRFRERARGFEAEAGEIVDAYWCREDASAVALTRRRARAPRRCSAGAGRSSSTGSTASRTGSPTDTHEIADLLHDCDILAIKAANGLESVPRAVVMQWLLLVESHLLGFIERYRDETRPTPSATTRFAASERAELRRIEDYYFRAGEKRARMRYVEGMLGLGVVFLFAAALDHGRRPRALRRARPRVDGACASSTRRRRREGSGP